MADNPWDDDTGEGGYAFSYRSSDRRARPRWTAGEALAVALILVLLAGVLL